MYEEYFELSGAPFKLNPDPKYFFGSRSHNKAMAYLHYGLKQAEGFIVITGPIGTGKTMLIGHLLDQLNRSNIAAAQLLTSNVGPDELLDHILSAFRIEPEGEGRTGQLEAFEDYLFDQLNRGRRVLLIMDEAQNLPRETLEELRMLSNIDYDGTPLFQVFLVGQPEFRDMMSAPDMEQLKQRVIASYHLENLTREETKEYILHRLSVAGWSEDPVFAESGIDAIFAETGGRPRRINTLCNRLMLYCALEKRHEITREVVDIVVSELRGEQLGSDEAKQVAMPPVCAVSETNASDGIAQENLSMVANSDVVVPIERALSKARAPAMALASPLTNIDGGAAQLATPMIPTQTSGAGSVFDRLRARRDAAPDDENDPPQPATLSDVASAIAAVSAGVEPGEGAAKRDGDAKAPPKDASQKAEWRKSVARSLNVTRDELKQAHGDIQRLRRTLKTIEKERAENRQEISESLDRAGALLHEIRKAWR